MQIYIEMGTVIKRCVYSGMDVKRVHVALIFYIYLAAVTGKSRQSPLSGAVSPNETCSDFLTSRFNVPPCATFWVLFLFCFFCLFRDRLAAHFLE